MLPNTKITELKYFPERTSAGSRKEKEYLMSDLKIHITTRDNGPVEASL